MDCVPPPPSHPQSHDGEDKYIPKPKGGALQEKWTNEENGLSSDDNGDFEYVLDCAPPPAPSQPQSHDGQDQHILEPKGDVLKPRTPTKSPSQVKAKTPAEETADLHPPVPKPRHSRNLDPQPSPVAKPRTVHLLTPSAPEKPSTPTKETAKTTTDPRPKQSLRKLQLTDEEKSQLVNLQSLSADSDSETHGGSSSCSSSSATAGGPSPPKPEGTDGQEEEGYWSGSTSGHVREKRNRRCFRRKEMPSGQTRVRSKFSPWNLSSPRISRDGRLSVLVNQPGRVGELKT